MLAKREELEHLTMVQGGGDDGGKRRLRLLTRESGRKGRSSGEEGVKREER